MVPQEETRCPLLSEAEVQQHNVHHLSKTSSNNNSNRLLNSQHLKERELDLVVRVLILRRQAQHQAPDLNPLNKHLHLLQEDQLW